MYVRELYDKPAMYFAKPLATSKMFMLLEEDQKRPTRDRLAQKLEYPYKTGCGLKPLYL